MKTLRLLLLAAALVLAPAVQAIDYARLAAQYLAKLEKGIADARAHPDEPQWWGQTGVDLKGLEESVAELPEAARAPYQAKIKEYQPIVAAGVQRDRGARLARRIRDALESAREELAKGYKPDNAIERLEGYLADQDVKGIPADELKKYQTEFADIKKRTTGK